MCEQLRNDSRCALVVLVPDTVPINSVVDEILLLDECSMEVDWAAGVLYLPVR